MVEITYEVTEPNDVYYRSFFIESPGLERFLEEIKSVSDKKAKLVGVVVAE